MHDLSTPRFTPLVELPRRRLYGFAVEQHDTSVARIATALAALGQWDQHEGPAVMIDLSCHEVVEPDVLAALDALVAGGVRADTLIVRVPRFDPDGPVACLDHLAEAGIGVAVIDVDFRGVEYGSLAGAPIDLIELPADTVALVDHDLDAAAFLRHLIDVAHTQDWMTLARSVTRGAQVDALERLGCDLIAGPAAGPAMSLEQAGRVATRHRPSDSRPPAPAICPR